MEIQNIDGRGQFQVPCPFHQVALGDGPHQAAALIHHRHPADLAVFQGLDKSAMEVSGPTVTFPVVMISRA